MDVTTVIVAIKAHIEEMGGRQRQLNAKIHDLSTEVQRLVDERCALEATLYKIEKEVEGE